MKFAVIDNNRNAMDPLTGRGKGFADALAEWTLGADYEFIRNETVAARREDLLRCRGLILSGSAFDLALPDDTFDREIYKRVIPQYEIMHAFSGPILGICFGHQMMALADDFDPERTDFGGLRLRNMPHPPKKHLVALVQLRSPLRFLRQQEVWSQFHHQQEVVLNEELQRHYEVIAGTENCRVHVMQHRRREWFGVQFHPEVGVQTAAGAVDRHDAAVADGKTVLRHFVHYCLR